MKFKKLLLICLIMLLAGSAVSAQTTSTVRMAYQPFQNGFMLWNSNINAISVYVNGSAMRAFPSWTFAWRSLDPVKDKAPTGFYKPILGFGKVWGHFPEVRQALGWATGAERAYNASVTFIPDGTSRITLPNGQTVQNDPQRGWFYMQNAAPTPFVNEFTVTPEGAKAGETVTITWRIDHVDQARLDIHDLSHSRSDTFTGLAANGSLQYTIPSDFSQWVVIELYGEKAGQPEATHSVRQIRILSAPFTTAAAFQPFENGFMIWRQDIDVIYVLFNNGSYRTFIHAEFEPLPDNPVTAPPPQGRVSPIRGFGRVWGNHSSVQSGLGWGLVAEYGYNASIELTANSGLNISFPDGQIARLELGGWRF